MNDNKLEIAARNRFLDITAFLISWRAVDKILEAEPALLDDHTISAHWSDSDRLILRAQRSLPGLLERIIKPILDEPAFLVYRPTYKIVARRTKGADHARIQANFLWEIFSRLKTRIQVLKSIFVDSRQLRVGRKLAYAAVTEDPRSTLNQIAPLQSLSSIKLYRTWIRKSAKLFGVEPDKTETLINDAAKAKDIGTQIQQLEARLSNLEPGSEEAAKISEEMATLRAELEILSQESDLPEAVLATGIQAAIQKDERAASGHVTEIGRKLTLSPEQEGAMMVRGRGIIAAGAGSGKTRVLAAKVAWHIQDLGLDPRQVMATSFSRKSAAELIERIRSYGTEIPDDAMTGFGTTHSISAKLLREYGDGGRAFLEKWMGNDLVRLAMRQVTMSSGKGGRDPDPVGIFEKLLRETGAAQAGSDTGLTFMEALELAWQRSSKLSQWHRKFLNSFFDPTNKWYSLTRSRTRNFKDPTGLSAKQMAQVVNIFKITGVQYSPATDPNLSGQKRASSEDPRTASHDTFTLQVHYELWNKIAARVKGKDEKKSPLAKYRFYHEPANQWFNLGPKVNLGPAGFYRTAISKMKGSLISPTQMWMLAGPASYEEYTDIHVTAAVYAAYEWLKGPRGEPEFAGRGDFTDVLLDAVVMMLKDPKARKAIQDRFKCILVDEAQDLNRAQGVLFGLIAGWIDPAKVIHVKPTDKVRDLANDDGSMTADTYVFIGDDDQAIYEFRGADPQTFVSYSDMVGGDFQTKVVKTNYRSGREIVDAAQRLILHNKERVPKVCEANPNRKDPGAIWVQSFSPNMGLMDHSGTTEAAQFVADDIQELMERKGPEVTSGEKTGYDSFGIAVRSNAEAYYYGLELIKRGIPFRSKANFFKDKTTKALINWLTIANEGIDGDRRLINKAVLGARVAPPSRLGNSFVEKLERRSTGPNHLAWLSENWDAIYGPRSKWSEYVELYTNNMIAVAGLKGQDSLDILNFILGLKGFNGMSMQDALVEAVKEDDELMANIIAEHGEHPPEDVIVEVALAPIAPLRDLLMARKDLAVALDYIHELQEANEKLTAEDDPDGREYKRPAVTIATIHAWKGLEVPNLYVPFIGGKFPRIDTSESEVESERRLAYVALTRAKNRCIILDIPTVIRRKTPSGGVVETVHNSHFIYEACVPFNNPPTGGESTTSTTIPADDLMPGDEDIGIKTGSRSLAEAWFSHDN